MSKREILSLIRLSPDQRAKIASVDASVRLTEAGGWFDGELRETWPEFAVRRYLPPDAKGTGTRAERDELLAEAEIIIGGWPFPLDLRRRAPKLRWFHQQPAGASNLRLGDLWQSDVVVTTARGYVSSVPIAEYVIAAIAHFARGLHRAAVDRSAHSFDHRAYRPVLLEGKTVCVVGVGGIGRQVGRLCAALGMKVVGTRSRPPAAGGSDRPEGFTEVRGPDGLLDLLSESDFVAICCQWTPETTGLIDAAAFRAMKPGAVLINIARGEIVDEAALVDALRADRLRGAALDVYDGEFEHPPPAALWDDPRVLITPHVSGHTDRPKHAGIDLFCENLKAYLEGRPMQNVVDWERGY